MHQPLTITAVITLAVLLTGCAHDRTDPNADRPTAGAAPPIARVLELDPPDTGLATTTESARGRPQAGESSTADVGDEPTLPDTATDGPDAVAARTVIELLETEGLYVLHLETQRDADVSGAGRVSVVVSVLHGTGRSHPHHARYRLGLAETDTGWDVTTIGAAS